MTQDQKPAAAAVEQNGVNPVPDGERHGTPRGLFAVWFSWNISILGVSYGIYVYGVGLSAWQAVVAGVLGYVLSAILVGKGNPSLQVLAAFATALDVPLSRLFESSELGEAGKEVLPGSGRSELIPPGFRRVNCILPESRASIVDEWAEIARKAIERKTGARGLRSIMESMLLDTMFDLPTLEGVQEVVISEEVIDGNARPLYIYSDRKDEKETASA